MPETPQTEHIKSWTSNHLSRSAFSSLTKGVIHSPSTRPIASHNQSPASPVPWILLKSLSTFDALFYCPDPTKITRPHLFFTLSSQLTSDLPGLYYYLTLHENILHIPISLFIYLFAMEILYILWIWPQHCRGGFNAAPQYATDEEKDYQEMICLGRKGGRF